MRMNSRCYKQNELISRDIRPLKRNPYNKYGFIFTSDFPISKPQFMSHSEERNDIVGVRCFFSRLGFSKGKCGSIIRVRLLKIFREVFVVFIVTALLFIIIKIIMET